MSMTLVVLLVLFVVLIAMSVPIAYSIGFASLIALMVDGTVPLIVVAQRVFVSIDSFPLLAAPFFVIAGEIMMVGGISRRLVNLAKELVGWMAGGMAYVTFVASALFGARSGSSVATTSAIGGLMYPELLKANYRPSYAAAIGATAGSLGVLIPPSIAFVIYGTQTNTSVGSLFLVGAAVGILAMVGYCIAVKLTLKKYLSDVCPSGPKPTLRSAIQATKDAFWGLLSPIIILGGIYSGKFTATEAAVVAIVYSILICMFVYKELTVKQLIAALIKSSINSGAILMLTGIASLFSWVITVNGLAAMLENFVLSMGLGLIGFLLIINLIYLILGMCMDTIPVIILTAPIFLPIARQYGISSLHFGALMIFNLIFGVITPPFGVDVFMANTYSKQPVMDIFRDCKWFWVAGVLMILIVTFVPLLMY